MLARSSFSLVWILVIDNRRFTPLAIQFCLGSGFFSLGALLLDNLLLSTHMLKVLITYKPKGIAICDNPFQEWGSFVFVPKKMKKSVG